MISHPTTSVQPATAPRRVLAGPAKKRLKLAISYDPDENGIAFTLSELMGKHRVLVKKEMVRVTKESLLEKGQRWHDDLKDFEQQFRDNCNALYERLSIEGSGRGINDKDLPQYVYTHGDWKTKVNEASISLADDIGRYIVDFSDDLLAEFLPSETTEFCRILNEELDTPTMEAYESGKPNAWLNMPLLQIRVERDILCLPWWLSRTYDKKSLWCCRYALAVSPTLDDTDPPAILLEEGGGVHILSITRPTSDLRLWLPISNATAAAAHPFMSDGVLTWRVLDGVLGDQHLKDLGDLPDRVDSADFDFVGVSKRMVRDALRSRKRTPNLIVYQGHWFNYRFENVAQEPPYIVLDDGLNRKSKKSVTNPLPSALLPVPLLSLIPSESSDKILIMNACSSGAAVNQTRLIQKYVQARSVFIGANYPLLADLSGPSVDVLIRSILKNQYLAHAISEVNWLQTDLNASPDTREVFQKAGLCLFGDVRTSLRQEMDEDTGDNLRRLDIKLTDRWAAGLERLGLKDYAGMTFTTVAKDISPVSDFALTDEGLQLALAPLVVAIELCNEDGSYVILGPAFSSRESVALISKDFESLEDFMEEFDRRKQKQKHVVLGLLSRKLTSSYMVELFLKNELMKRYDAVEVEHLWKKLFHAIFAYHGGKGGVSRLADPEFLAEADISLTLNQSKAELMKLGHPIADDLETQVVDLLGLKAEILPRGIFLTKRRFLESQKSRVEIIDFCNEFNTRILEGNSNAVSDPADGEPEDIALLTYDRAEAKCLHAIHQFAHTGMFTEGFGWENFSHRPQTEATDAQVEAIVLGIDNVKWSDKSRAEMEDDSAPAARGLQTLKDSLDARQKSQPTWHLTRLYNILESEVNKSTLLSEPIKVDLRKYFAEKIEEIKNLVIPVN